MHAPVLRLVEEVKLRASNCQLQNEDVYMNTTFQEFIQMCVRKLRGEDDEEELVVDYVSAVGCLLLTGPRGRQQRVDRCLVRRWRRTSTT